MLNVFDLSKISRLVESQHPARILVMDTNILMNDPDPTNWSVKADGRNLFVLSDTLILELEFIRRKEGSKERAESRDKAKTASKSLESLYNQGNISEGIPVKAGWFIGVPHPKKDELDRELQQIEDIEKVFKRSDTKLLLLTRECHQLFQSTPVTLLTGDRNLFLEIQMQGIPCHSCTGFPIERLKEAAATTKPVDWDRELAEMQSKIAENSVVVEATLTAQRVAPPWLMLLTGTKRFMIAEGRGVMRAGNNVRPFLWTIPFYPQTLDPRSSDDNEGLTDLPSIHLDFFGEDNFEQDLFDAIADRLLDCTNLSFEEGTPTLQSPEFIMEMLLYFEYIAEYLDEQGISGALAEMRQEIEESEGLIHYWTDWILNKEDEDERYSCLEGFIEALNECWKIGQTYTFSVITGEKR